MKRLIVLIIAILVPTAVVAKNAGECQDDMEKFCKGITASAELHACMAQHDAELSPACKAVRDAHAKDKPKE
jgi:hypothetical protein